MSEVPIYAGMAPNPEQQRMAAFFEETEKKQVDFLDEAGKRIIELITLLLGVLFTVVAFGDKFPPPYLASNAIAKLVSTIILACYVVALALAFRVVHPRDYRLYRYNLNGMRQERDKILRNKRHSLFWAGVTFWSGSVGLAVLIGMIIWSA